MNPVQFEIEGRTWALLPLDEYQALCRQLEDATDAESMRRAQSREEESFPSSFVERLLLSGENPVRVWREHRGLTAAELARRANVSNAHISAIETALPRDRCRRSGASPTRWTRQWTRSCCHDEVADSIRGDETMAVDPTRPPTYPRRILVVVTGMSPQVVTETVYALAVPIKPAWLPTEIRLVTTRKGARIAKRHLLNGDKGWFHRLRQDYQLPPIDFDAQRIHTLSHDDGEPLDDIQTPADNTATADAITQLLCELTRDDASALHVSIAGGRKTMGFYLGYALSLYGRAQDRLSHVLVNPPYESNPEFFYPTPTERLIETRDGDVVDAQDARVGLAEIPFVRLREGLPHDLLEGKIRFHDAVDAAQRALGQVELVIDLRGKRVGAGGRILHLPPVQLAFLAWLARRQKKGLHWLRCPSDGAPEREHGVAFMREYNAVVGPMGANDRTAQRLAAGMDTSFFSQTKTKLHTSLKGSLGRREAAAYIIASKGRKPTVYGLDIEPNAIRFEALAP